MKALLSNESLLGRIFGALGDIIIVNLLFVVSCVPLVTIGAACSAMNYAFLKRRRLSGEPISRLYLSGFKSNVKQATITWLILIGLTLFLGVDAYAFSARGPLSNRSLAIIFAAMLAIVCFFTLYVFAVICTFSGNLRTLFVQTFAFAAGHIPTTLLLALPPILIVGLLLVSFQSFAFVLSLLLLFGCGAIGWLYSFLYIRLFNPYLDPLE